MHKIKGTDPIEQEVYVRRDFKLLCEKYNLSGDCGRVCFIGEASRILADIKDSHCRNRWIREAAKLANVDERAVALEARRELSKKGRLNKDNAIQHQKICAELTALYERKNHDYGDSFHKSYQEYGMVMPLMRIGDKLNRLKTLSKCEKTDVTDESIRDTLMDLANYAVMTIRELDDGTGV